MTRITPVSPDKLRRIFEMAGFRCSRIEGDHYFYTKTGIQRPIVIPNWHMIPVFIIKNNLRTAGISREQYFELLLRV